MENMYADRWADEDAHIYRQTYYINIYEINEIYIIYIWYVIDIR